jgi:hypothetical protein
MMHYDATVKPVDWLRSRRVLIFWDITPCSPSKFGRRFGGTYRLHFQGRRISRARNQRKGRWPAQLILRPWRWRRYVPPKRRLNFNRLHGVITQKIVFFITTSVRTTNPAWLTSSLILEVLPQTCPTVSNVIQRIAAREVVHSIGA